MSKKKNKATRGEKRLWFFIVLILFSTPLINVITKAKLSETNIEVERLKKKIETQKNLNESISMKINELASLDKIQDIALENGLSYKNNNIKSIDGE